MDINKIPTAEEFANNAMDSILNNMSSLDELSESFKEFAKLHVEAALKAASKVELDDVALMPESNDFEESRILSILNAYPLENIQ